MSGPSGFAIASLAISVVFGGVAMVVALRADRRSRDNEKREGERDARSAAAEQRARLIASIVHEDRQRNDARGNLIADHRVYLRVENWGPSPAGDIQFVPSEHCERLTGGTYAVPVLHPGQGDRCSMTLYINDPSEGILEGQLSWTDGAGSTSIPIHLTVV